MNAIVDTDRIERSIHIEASRERVWRALTNAGEFGAWFGADLSGQSFVPGQRVRGPTTTPGYEHLFFDAVIDRIEPQERLSFQWHPYSGEPEPDHASEEPTLVTFTLQEVTGGVLLTVVESGFDRLPAARRRIAFDLHTEGWNIQLQNVARHVGH